LKPTLVRHLRLLLLFAVCSIPAAIADSTAAQSDPVTPSPAAELSLSDAAILGTVEGVTEFLPVSSTGHLIIANRTLHLDSVAVLKRPDGAPLWYKKPTERHPTGEPLTLKLAADTYAIVIQFGAIAAVALLYWRRVISILRGALGLDPAGARLLRSLLLAFFPAAVLGLTLHDWIDNHLFSVGAVIIAQVAGAVLIFWAEWYRRRHPVAMLPENAPLQLTAKQSLNIGLLQCAALWPGTSRSMMTIIGGYLSGLDPRRSAEFSFLLGLVTLTAATVFKSYKSGAAMIEVFGWAHVLFGCVVAAVTAALAVKFLVGWLSRHGMILFAFYRLALAAVLAAFLWL
jgi:undecaprenyl-diphosphatase